MTSGPVIHIVDDDEAIRDSLSFMLEMANYETRSYDLAAALLARLEELEPGCILSDVRMPGMSGLELVGELKRRGVALPVVMLTGHGDVALAVEAMKAGVADFLEKPFNDEALLSAIRSAIARGASEADDRADRDEIARRVGELTAREREVFEAIVSGESNKSAAIKLGISPRTVEIYRANVMEKMKAASLSDLVRMALRLE